MSKDWKKSLTFKGDGAFSHPWLVIKGDTVEDLQDQLSEAHEKDLFTAIGRAHAAMERGVMMGSKLDATTIKSEPVVNATPKQEASASTTPTTASPGPFENAAPAEQAAPPPAVPSGAPKPAWAKK